MNDHPNKHIRKAIEYAFSLGWRLVKSGPRAHAGGAIVLSSQCPEWLYHHGLWHASKSRKPRKVHSALTGCLSARRPNNLNGDTSDLGGVGLMRLYEFDVVLKDVAEISDDQANALFEAGCDDGTPTSSDGQAWVHFDREAKTLEDAIRSAVGQVRKAGILVARVEIAADAATFLPH